MHAHVKQQINHHSTNISMPATEKWGQGAIESQNTSLTYDPFIDANSESIYGLLIV
jgi:hypothetical protein